MLNKEQEHKRRKIMIRNIFKVFCGFLAVCGTAASLTSCSDSFLEEKQNYEAIGQDVYNHYEGALGRINDLYGWCLPSASGNLDWRYPSVGRADDAGKSTEEYTSFSDFVNGETYSLSSTTKENTVPDFYGGQNMNDVTTAVYGAVRNINNAIEGIQASSLNEEQKNKLLGQAYFFRAWTYYKMVKWYGGVPIVDKVLEPTPSSFVQRSSAKACFDFIISDLNQSAALLSPYTTNGGWSSNEDYGRITSGTALALKGRVLLLWCSPLFNRANDPARWTAAYNTMSADLATIKACGYGLYGEGNPGVNGSTFANMFATLGKNPEAVFFTLYNNRVDFSGYADDVKNNKWERDIRPSNTGGGGISPSSMIVNLFPMSDGKHPASYTSYDKLDPSTIPYDPQYPFIDRDPRFYRTFAFPGVRWAYTAGGHGDATAMDGNNPSYDGGANYALWNYVWFYAGDSLDVNNTNYRGADNLGGTRGIMVRKRSDDADVNSALYDYRPDGQGAKNGGEAVPFCSAAPYMELRYAEVLLNLAEVAAMTGHTSEAYGYIKDIRRRAGYTGDCGVTESADPATCISAILYERQIEFAFEGKRFDDMRRWMLFDGGTELPTGAPNSWKPTGWNNDVCNWLGFKKFNGQRREGFIYRVKPNYTVSSARQSFDQDPLVEQGVARPAAVDLRQDLTAQLDNLKTWYDTYLTYMERPGDERYSDYTLKYIKFLPQYYFLGFSYSVSNHNNGLLQTIGWQDYNTGGAWGTFDPLAE
jgi:hypothetical protein